MKPGSIERIAHYRIERRVGRGGMGIVYRAIDERDGRVVALKVIREAESTSTDSEPHVIEARVRFQREAEIMRGLLHVNVVSFHEIGEEDGTPYLAMEFLDGVPLGSLAGRPFTETLPLLVQAAHGMEYLASRGIVHRDLSPDNIFVVESRVGDGGAGATGSGGSGGRSAPAEHHRERVVKLLDFGVARLFETPTGRDTLTATGFFLGKVAYGSPEQLGSLGHGAPLDWRSDVYSLGVIFFHVLAGRKPFEGKAPVEYIAAHLNLAPPPVAAPPHSPALPMELVRLVSQMLDKRREARPGYREIIDRLVGVLRDAGRPAPSVGPAPEGDPPTHDGGTAMTALVNSGGSSTSRAETLPARVSTVRMRRLAAAAGVLVPLLAFLFLWSRPRPPARAERAPGKPRPAGVASGGIRLLAAPFARVVSITEGGSGRPMPLPAGAYTPLLVSPLAAGTYRVVLTCPVLDGRSVERDVLVTPGPPVLLAEAFVEPSRLVEMMR